MKPPRQGKPQESGLIRAGETNLLKNILQQQTPALSLKPEKPFRITKAGNKFADAAVEIHQDPPTSDELAYMARELVQCTLPHSDPGQVPFWKRTNGNLTLSIVSGFDPRASQLVGYPYGSIPRLLIFWITTEALRTASRHLHLGPSYASFLRDIGLDPNTGGGKRSDAKRVREQTRRLFAASISFIQTIDTEDLAGERRLNMPVAEASELWWNPKHPEQATLWDSWVELGHKFYDAITTAPVPVDIRALKALKRSPLALDLYAWSTHKALAVARKGKPQFVPWRGLMAQFGADYTDHKNFKKNAQDALRKIQSVYPGLRLASADGGIVVLPSSRPAVAMKPSKRTLT
jgi:hypothetical protein